jgi:hypothetical protein
VFCAFSRAPLQQWKNRRVNFSEEILPFSDFIPTFNLDLQLPHKKQNAS